SSAAQIETSAAANARRFRRSLATIGELSGSADARDWRRPAATSAASALRPGSRGRLGQVARSAFCPESARELVDQLIVDANRQSGNLYRLVAILDAKLEELAAAEAVSSSATDLCGELEAAADDSESDHSPPPAKTPSPQRQPRRVVPSRLSSLVPTSTSAATSSAAAPAVSASDFNNVGANNGDDNLAEPARSMARTLQDCLARLLAKIRRLERQELSLDDLDNSDSAYLRAERLQRQACDVYRRLCRVRNAPSVDQFNYRCHHHPQIGLLICRYVNRRGRFPDMHKVSKVVAWVNQRFRLGWSKPLVAQRSEQIFRDVGEQLQQRRWRQLRQNLGLDEMDGQSQAADPADSSPRLRRQLDASQAAGAARLAEVMRSFASMPERPGGLVADSGSEPSSDEEAMEDDRDNFGLEADQDQDQCQGEQHDDDEKSNADEEVESANVDDADAASSEPKAEPGGDDLEIEPEVETETAPLDSVAKIGPSGATTGTLSPPFQQQQQQPWPMSSSSSLAEGDDALNETAGQLAAAVRRFAAAAARPKSTVGPDSARIQPIDQRSAERPGLEHSRRNLQPLLTEERPLLTAEGTSSATKPLSSLTKPLPSATNPLPSSEGTLSSAEGTFSSSTKPLPSATNPLLMATKPLPSATQPFLSSARPLTSATKPLLSATKPLPSTAQRLRSAPQQPCQKRPRLGQAMSLRRPTVSASGQAMSSNSQAMSIRGLKPPTVGQPISNRGQPMPSQRRQQQPPPPPPILSGPTISSATPGSAQQQGQGHLVSERRRRHLADAVRRAVADLPQPEVIIID
ncbi:hypothetical protein BOX15_Mlig021349g6, partial [Macrostomum lignano]